MYPSQHWNHRRSKWSLFSLAIIAVLILGAYGVTTSVLASRTRTSSPTGSLTTSPADMLHKSTTAMQQLRSTHFTLSRSTTQTSSSSVSGPAVWTTNADVDEVLPDQTQISFNDNNRPKIPEVVKGGQVYIQTLKGKWYQFPNSQETTNCLSLLPITKYTNPLAILLPHVQDTSLTDHKTEKLNGQNLRHITVALGNNAFDTLAELGMVYRVIDGKTHQELVKLDNAVLDVWIDEATSYVHHLTLKSNTTFDRSSLGRSLVSATSSMIQKVEKDLTIDYSQFNQVASIATPANATPYVASAPPALPGLCPFQLTTVIKAD